jgi:hypothetical protein
VRSWGVEPRPEAAKVVDLGDARTAVEIQKSARGRERRRTSRGEDAFSGPGFSPRSPAEYATLGESDCDEGAHRGAGTPRVATASKQRLPPSPSLSQGRGAPVRPFGSSMMGAVTFRGNADPLLSSGPPSSAETLPFKGSRGRRFQRKGRRPLTQFGAIGFRGNALPRRKPGAQSLAVPLVFPALGFIPFREAPSIESLILGGGNLSRAALPTERPAWGLNAAEIGRLSAPPGRNFLPRWFYEMRSVGGLYRFLRPRSSWGPVRSSVSRASRVCLPWGAKNGCGWRFGGAAW